MPKSELNTLVRDLDRVIQKTARLDYRMTTHLLRIARLDLAMRQHRVTSEEVKCLADTIRQAQQLQYANQRLP